MALHVGPQQFLLLQPGLSCGRDHPTHAVQDLILQVIDSEKGLTTDAKSTQMSANVIDKPYERERMLQEANVVSCWKK